VPDPPRRPPAVPGIPGAKLPPPGRQQVPPVHPRRSGDTHVGLAPPAPMSAPGAPGSDFTTTIESADPVPAPRVPGQAPPRSLSPPPVSKPTSEEERQTFALRAELAQARQELAAARVAPVQVDTHPPPSRRTAADVARGYAAPSGIVAALVTALAAILKPAPAPESVDAQGARLAVLEQQAAQARARELDWREYDRRRREAQRCRDTELGSALARLGYRTSLPRDAEAFLSERLDDGAAVRPSAPAWRPRDRCPPLPDPPP
jgi:hypothetical protein